MKEIERALRGGTDVERAAEDAAKRFADRALAEQLVDVAYGYTDSPFGRFLLASTPRGLVKLEFHPDPIEEILEVLARKVSPRVLEMPSRFDDVRRELDEYFDGRRREFDLPLDWRLIHGFSERVLRATAKIPYGGVKTYRDVAVGLHSAVRDLRGGPEHALREPVDQPPVERQVELPAAAVEVLVQLAPDVVEPAGHLEDTRRHLAGEHFEDLFDRVRVEFQLHESARSRREQEPPERRIGVTVRDVDELLRECAVGEAFRRVFRGTLDVRPAAQRPLDLFHLLHASLRFAKPSAAFRRAASSVPPEMLATSRYDRSPT